MSEGIRVLGGADEEARINDSRYVTSAVGVLIYEDSQGFVYVTYFHDKDRMESVWSDIVEDESLQEQGYY